MDGKDAYCNAVNQPTDKVMSELINSMIEQSERFVMRKLRAMCGRNNNRFAKM